MNLSFIIGFVLALFLVIFGIIFGETSAGTIGIELGKLGNFADITSFFVTVGGTFGTLIACFPFRFFANVPKHIGIIMGRNASDPIYYINAITDLSQEARKKGLLALEDSVSEFEDEFLKSSVMLIVDAMEPDKVRSQLENELNNIEARHASVWNMYDKGAALAPAFGMIGTLIGLVNMLKSMDFEDEGGASKLAQDMSVALITTFYGSVLANVLFIPMGNQLRVAHEDEMLCKEIIIEGIISIQAGENPRHINEKLLTYLTMKQRYQAQDSASGGGE